MKMAPAAAAATPAALVSPVGVTVMAGSWSSVLAPGGVSGDVIDRRKRPGERTSPSDVTRLVIADPGRSRTSVTTGPTPDPVAQLAGPQRGGCSRRAW